MSPETRSFLRELRSALSPKDWAAIVAWSSTFYPFQREWLFDPSRFSLLNKSRQTGASHTYGAQAALLACLGETTTVISKGERESLEVLQKAERHRAALAEIGFSLAKGGSTATEMTTVTGGRVLALPASSGGRSFSGNVILDEFAYHQNADAVWDGAAAVALHGYRIRVLSTPNGVGNRWHKMWTDPKAHAGWRLHAVTIDDAIAQGMRVNMDECWALAHGDPRLFDQLFRCAFLDGADQYIPTAAITACTVKDPYCVDGDCYAGLDIGRTNDRTDLVIIRKTPEIVDTSGSGERVLIQPSEFWQVHSESRKRTESDDLFALAELAFGPPFFCRRLCVDATGMGAFPASDLQREFGQMRVEPVTFTSRSKEDMATTLFSVFVNGRIRIDAADTQLRDDLCSLRREITSAGNVRYDAPTTEKGHGDRAWALALALHGCTGPGYGKHVVGHREVA